MSEPIYIDGSINILTGEEALRALERRNDKPFFDEGKGVGKVSAERWHEAQQAAETHWMVRGTRSMSDHNEENYRELDGFRALEGMRFRRALEIGCGPFSNSRYIARVCGVERLDFLDPLLETYRDHPFCRFKDGRLILEGAPGAKLSRLAWKVAARLSPGLFLSLKRAVGGTVRLGEMLPLPAEEMPTGNGYDLIAIINVIEHCYDAERIFANILAGSARDAVLVFQDELYDSREVAQELETEYDAAHPIKLDGAVIEGFLETNFRPLYRRKKVFPYRTSRGDVKEKRMISFIGKRI